MEKLPARTGWLWLKEGFNLFQKQPIGMSTLFLGYLFLMFVIGAIPIIGQILPLILVPVFSITFMQACVHLEQNKKIHPNLLLTGFRSSSVNRLLLLGVLYLSAAILAIGASAMIDGGLFWQTMMGQTPLDRETVRNSNMSLAMLFSAAVYTPAAMAFWHASPLIAWQNMNIGKAIFYSFFAVKHSGKAFMVYGLAWLLIGVLIPAIASSLIGLLFNRAAIAMLLLLPLSLIMTVVMYCSFYPTYTYVFGKPYAT